MFDLSDPIKSDLVINDYIFTIAQKELAERTEISVNTIRGWFSKDLVPDVFNAVKVAKALNTTVEYLVTGENNNKAAQELTELKAKLADLIMFKK